MLIIFLLLLFLLLLSLSLSDIVNSNSNSNSNSNILGKFNDCNAALEAAKLSNCLCIGMKCKDGALLAALPKKNNDNSNDNNNDNSNDNSNIGIVRWIENERKYLYKIDDSIGVGIVGIPSDTLHVVQLLREEALEYRSKMGITIPLSLLADSVSDYFYNLVSNGETRPLAVDIILISGDDSYDTIQDTNMINTNVIKLSNSGSYQECKFCITQTLIDDNNNDNNNLSIIDKCMKELNQIKWNDLTCKEASIECQKFATRFGLSKPHISFIHKWKYTTNNDNDN